MISVSWEVIRARSCNTVSEDPGTKLDGHSGTKTAIFTANSLDGPPRPTSDISLSLPPTGVRLIIVSDGEYTGRNFRILPAPPCRTFAQRNVPRDL